MYERGTALFKYPHVADIWAAYLKSFVARCGAVCAVTDAPTASWKYHSDTQQCIAACSGASCVTLLTEWLCGCSGINLVCCLFGTSG